MITYARFKELPLSAIKPDGWLRRYLEKQRDGLTGHLEAAGSPFDSAGWGLPKVEIHYEASVCRDWWPYEQTGYWIDGMIRCGYLLDDKFLITKARRHIDHVLENPGTDGYLGPDFLKAPVGWNRWAHAVFFRAIMAHYSATGDSRVLPGLAGHYLSHTSPHWEMREVCNLEAILWTYERTHDRRLLEHALKAYEGFNRCFPSNCSSLESMLSERWSVEHGVTFNEIAKLGAILYIHTGNDTYLKASINAYRKLDRDQMLIDGVCSSSENLRGKDPLDSHETCVIADFTWSTGYLLLATGLAEYADKIEKACFNAAPGAVRSDFKGLQYFSCPNQVIADQTSNHNFFHQGTKWMSYRPNPGTECCPGAVNRIMPNFASRMWLSDGSGGLVPAFYGPSTVITKVGKENQTVTIVEETGYPFSERVDFRIKTPVPVKFALYLRIPGWCGKAQLEFNGKPVKIVCSSGTFIKFQKVFSDNDLISLVLPMDLQLIHWPGGGVAIERGPLVYALKIKEDWRIDETETRCTKDFPAWNLYPGSPWNYALAVDEHNLQDEVKIINRPLTSEPWSIDNAPIELQVPARRVVGWKLQRKKAITAGMIDPNGDKIVKVTGDFQFTPALPDPETLVKRLGRKLETVTLVPYGCTKLRITIFPWCK
jgi:uncharacterized protein